MNNLYIKTNYQFLIHILFLFQIFLSKQSKINPILSNIAINKPYKEMLRDELYEKYEELLEKQKLMEKNIKDLKEKNYEFNLLIETNHVYIIILYIIMSIIIFIGIIFAIIKLYYQCHKKSNSISTIEINDKSYLNKDV